MIVLKPAFSLIELLIALAISAVIMVGLVQGNRNAAHLLREAQSLLIVNRQVALLYNQLERDVTAALVYQKPTPYPAAKPQTNRLSQDGFGELGGAATEKKEDKKEKENGVAESEKPVSKDKKGEKEKFIPSCLLEPFEEGVYKVGTKKWQQTKKFSFLTTTPLEVFEQEHERMVRVGYELVYDKKMSTPQKSVYTLYRMQTDDLENFIFKEDEEKKVKKVSRYVVADHIKQFSLEALYDQRPPQKKDGSQLVTSEPVASAGSLTEEGNSPTQLKTFVWGEKEEKEKSKTVLPDMFATHIEVWDGAIARSYSFTSTFPVFVKTEAISKKEEKKNEGEKPGNGKPEDKPATPPIAQEGA